MVVINTMLHLKNYATKLDPGLVASTPSTKNLTILAIPGSACHRCKALSFSSSAFDGERGDRGETDGEGGSACNGFGVSTQI